MSSNIFIAMIIGFLGGLLRACQGAYKDTPWEPFKKIKFTRSLVIGTVAGIFWWWILAAMSMEIHPAQFMALVVFTDSIITELYKRGFRTEDLSKYKMPTIFHINGNIIENRLTYFSFMNEAHSCLITESMRCSVMR